MKADSKSTLFFLKVIALVGVLYGTETQRDQCIEANAQDPLGN